MLLRLFLAGGVIALAASSEAQQRLYEHGDPSDFEQLALELINEVRMDPTGASGLHLAPMEPLAFHPGLNAVARQHSVWLEQTDLLTHTGAGGCSTSCRIDNSSDPLTGRWGTAENIGRQGNSRVRDSPQNLVRRLRNWLFASGPHQSNTLRSDYRQIGLGFTLGNYRKNGTLWLGAYLVEDYAYTQSLEGGTFVLGVCYDDKNKNHAYDPGEGIRGVRISPKRGDFYTQTSTSGGYTLPIAGGENRMEIHGADIGTLRKYFDAARGNIKFDIRKQDLPRVIGGANLGEIEVSLGKEVTLEVSLGGAPSSHVRWLRDGRPVRQGTGSLRIPAFSANDAGTYEVEVQTAEDQLVVVAGVAKLLIGPGLAERFEEWSHSRGIRSGQLGDDDGDGFSNLFEFILGQDPHDLDTLHPPQVDSVTKRFHWTVPIRQNIDAEYVSVEVCQDTDWLPPKELGLSQVRAPGSITVSGSLQTVPDLLLRLRVTEDGL